MAQATASGMVVLCGSGVSAVAPSFVPSWRRLNVAALDGLRDLALARVVSSLPNRAAVASLTLNDIPLVAFSQVLSDAFAGRHWLTILTVLDGSVPNAVHRMLASLLGESRCRAIVTTNFDTLTELAAQEAGLDVPVVLPGDPANVTPDAALPAIYKIHGSVDRPESMIDLLVDKGRGLDPDIRSRLAAVCSGRHLVVLGFSGEDFAMDHDYLGLLGATGLPERVTWVARPGSGLSAGASAFLDAIAARGVPVSIEEHELLDLVGVAASEDTAAPEEPDRLLVDHVRDWIEDALIYPPTAALVLAELLRLRGQTAEAAALRAEIRLAMSRLDREIGPFTVKEAVVRLGSAPAAWALLGKEERTGEFAMADLERAELAADRFDRFLATNKIVLRGPAVAEQHLLRAAIRQNTAVQLLHAGDVATADTCLAAAEQILAEVPGLEAVRRIAGIRYRRALHALVRGKLGAAISALENSIECAARCGDVHLEAASTLLLAMCLRAGGDESRAAVLDRRATRLDLTTTDAVWRRQIEELVRDGSAVLASGRFSDLVDAIAEHSDQ
jgi:hypothetical protein